MQDASSEILLTELLGLIEQQEKTLEHEKEGLDQHGKMPEILTFSEPRLTSVSQTTVLNAILRRIETKPFEYRAPKMVTNNFKRSIFSKGNLSTSSSFNTALMTPQSSDFASKLMQRKCPNFVARKEEKYDGSGDKRDFENLPTMNGNKKITSVAIQIQSSKHFEKLIGISLA